ncbi:MAG: DHHA1 domain-containing protein [Acidobacteriota bacterium]
MRRLETPAGPAVVLEETYFYPESGGQPHDLGTIDDIPITKITEHAEDVVHVLTRMPDRDWVPCRIDEKRRSDHMHQHDGQHILSSAFLQEAEAQTLSFHLGSATSSIDLDKANLSPTVIAAAEELANQVVRRALPVRSYFVHAEEASGLELRKAPEVEGVLRIVEIEGFDRQACCGTHPRNTAEVGPIFIRSVERLKKATRIHFVCGLRALRDHRVSVERLRSLAQVLNSSEEDLVGAASRLVEEKKALGKSLQSYREEALRTESARWIADAETCGGWQLIVREVPHVTPAELRLLAMFLTSDPCRVVLLGAVAEGRAHLVFGRSADVPMDMAALLKAALPAVDGRGGGSARMAQGGGARLEGTGRALQIARERLAPP